MPGRSPHPHRDPDGHAAGFEPPDPGAWTPAGWRENDDWLHAVDLFNGGFWWECHEALEGLWNAAGRTTPAARFVQGLLWVAAGLLNHRRGRPAAARRQVDRGLRRLAAEDRDSMGIDAAALEAGAEAYLAGSAPPPEIQLDGIETAERGDGP